MQKKSTFAKVAAAALAAVFAIALTSFATLAASQFEGVWKVQDTAGKPFQITLSADGSAKADRAGEGLTGTWKEEGGAGTPAGPQKSLKKAMNSRRPPTTRANR